MSATWAQIIQQLDQTLKQIEKVVMGQNQTDKAVERIRSDLEKIVKMLKPMNAHEFPTGNYDQKHFRDQISKYNRMSGMLNDGLSWQERVVLAKLAMVMYLCLRSLYTHYADRKEAGKAALIRAIETYLS